MLKNGERFETGNTENYFALNISFHAISESHLCNFRENWHAISEYAISEVRVYSTQHSIVAVLRSSGIHPTPSYLIGLFYGPPPNEGAKVVREFRREAPNSQGGS